MKTKILLFFTVLIISLNLAALAYAQSGNTFWREDFNYASVSQMQAAGWVVSRPSGTSIDNGAVVLNGVGGDSAIGIRNILSSPVYNWRAEAKNMWLGHGHSTQSITVYTEKHKYVWSADGYYNEFVLYRDDVKVLRFGKYQEAANTWITLTMEKNQNTISLYFNGQLENSYSETDTSLAKVTGVDLVSPWKGDAKYDYVWVEDASIVGPPPTSIATSTSAPAQTSFPMIPVLIGGGIAAAVGIGAAVYYFVVAGGSAGASAGAGAGSAGITGAEGAGSGEGGSGSGYPTGDGASEGESPVPDSGDAGGGIAEGAGIGAEGPSQNTSTEGSGAVVGSAVGGAAGSGGLTLEQINNFNQAMGALQNMIETSQTTAMSSVYDNPIGGGGGGPGTSSSAPSVFDNLTSQGQQLINQAKMQDSFDQAKYDQYMEQFTKLTQQIEQALKDSKPSTIQNLK